MLIILLDFLVGLWCQIFLFSILERFKASQFLRDFNQYTIENLGDLFKKVTLVVLIIVKFVLNDGFQLIVKTLLLPVIVF